jgi:hypothetical protein
MIEVTSDIYCEVPVQAKWMFEGSGNMLFLFICLSRTLLISKPFTGAFICEFRSAVKGDSRLSRYESLH